MNMENKRERQVGMKKTVRENLVGYGFMLPWLIGFFAFFLFPFVYSLYLSFTNYSMKPDLDFVGLKNYELLLKTDTLFRTSSIVTAKYVLIGVPLQLLFALLLAMALNRNIPGLKFFRAAYYLPALMGGSVAVAILWRQLFGTEGLVNHLLSSLGFPDSVTSTSWIASSQTSLSCLILLRVWQFGSPMIIFLAALKQVPTEMYESAAIDGANGVQRFFKITIPMISPIILYNLMMQIVSASQSFTSAYVISNGSGGTANSLLFYTLYLYKMGFNYFKMGIASAMAWILMVVIGVLVAILYKTSDAWVFYNE